MNPITDRITLAVNEAAEAIETRRLTGLADLDHLTDAEADRIAVQLNRRAACDPVVLASVERINDYHPEEDQ